MNLLFYSVIMIQTSVNREMITKKNLQTKASVPFIHVIVTTHVRYV